MFAFAKRVSFAFHYIFVVPITFIFLLYKFPITGDLKIMYPLAFTTIFIVMPLIFVAIALKKGLVSDFEASKREERYLSNVVGVCVTLAFFIFTDRLALPDIYKTNALYYFLYGCVFGLITFYWKISYHLGVLGWVTALFFTIYGFYSWLIIPLLLIVLVTAWSRVYLKKHDVPQVVVAYVISILLFELVKIITNFR